MKRLALLLLVGCTETKGPLEGPQSIEVELVAPVNPGDVNNRLLDTQRTVTINVRVKDSEGNIYTTREDGTPFNETVRVYAQFLGTLTPDLETQPLTSVDLAAGVATNVMVNLANVRTFGPTTLWVDNGTGLGPDYQFGALVGNSPTLWYRDPFVADLQRPFDETRVDALSQTPLSDKQVRVASSRYGARGTLVVTSTFAQGYTVADVQCASGGTMPTPPCTTNHGPLPGMEDDGYDHVMVFTFSAPRDQFGRPLVEGTVIESFNGGLTEFNGLTEIGFPRTFIHDPDPATPERPEPYVNRALMPAPVLFDVTWFNALDTSTACRDTGQCTGRIHFERNEAGPIEIRSAKVCPIDDAPDGVYARFKQWTIDPNPGGTCDASSSAARAKLINLITAGTDFTTDPHTLVGRTLQKIVGIVRPVNLQGFNVWIVYPRGKDDIVL